MKPRILVAISSFLAPFLTTHGVGQSFEQIWCFKPASLNSTDMGFLALQHANCAVTKIPNHYTMFQCWVQCLWVMMIVPQLTDAEQSSPKIQIETICKVGIVHLKLLKGSLLSPPGHPPESLAEPEKHTTDHEPWFDSWISHHLNHHQPFWLVIHSHYEPLKHLQLVYNHQNTCK